MNPRGPIPQSQEHLDECLFHLQGLADCQQTNTGEMLERFREVFADGTLDERDTEAVVFLYHHTRLEHRWNTGQMGGLSELRKLCNGFFVTLARFRGQLQEMKKATRDGGLQTNQAIR